MACRPRRGFARSRDTDPTALTGADAHVSSQCLLCIPLHWVVLVNKPLVGKTKSLGQSSQPDNMAGCMLHQAAVIERGSPENLPEECDRRKDMNDTWPYCKLCKSASA